MSLSCLSCSAVMLMNHIVVNLHISTCPNFTKTSTTAYTVTVKGLQILILIFLNTFVFLFLILFWYPVNFVLTCLSKEGEKKRRLTENERIFNSHPFSHTMDVKCLKN